MLAPILVVRLSKRAGVGYSGTHTLHLVFFTKLQSVKGLYGTLIRAKEKIRELAGVPKYQQLILHEEGPHHALYPAYVTGYLVNSHIDYLPAETKINFKSFRVNQSVASSNLLTLARITEQYAKCPYQESHGTTEEDSTTT